MRIGPTFSIATPPSRPPPLILLRWSYSTDDRTKTENRQPSQRYLEVCSGPTHMQFHDAGRGSLLFITCFEGARSTWSSPQAPQVMAIIEAGHGPTALTFSPTDPTIAFVAGYADNNVSVIDLEPGSPTEYMVEQDLGFPHAVTQ